MTFPVCVWVETCLTAIFFIGYQVSLDATRLWLSVLGSMLLIYAIYLRDLELSHPFMCSDELTASWKATSIFKFGQ